ncbi:hypothetical protein NECID01_1805 [Nematocida sp. AWRm77]|nr:hypothetical protein NECID01_1805 [Nematocida sp. AWRm77]
MVSSKREKQITLYLCVTVSAYILQSVQVSVEFLLADNTKIVDTVSPGAFGLLNTKPGYSQLKHLNESTSGMQVSPLACLDTAAHSVESIKLALTGIHNEVEYAQFRSLCSMAYPEKKDTTALKEMLLDQFRTFLCTANYLGICGLSLKSFAQKMVKYGLLGAHSSKIIKEMSLLGIKCRYEVVWSMLLAFLDCMEFQARFDLTSSEPDTLVIKKGYSQAYTYWDPIPRSIKKIVLKHKLPKRKNRKRHTNEKILTWFLEYLGCHSLHLEYCIEARSVMNSQLLPNLQKSLSQKYNNYNNSRMKIYIESLSLSIWSLDSYESLRPVFKFYNSLSSLTINICIVYNSKTNFLILARHFSLCKSLKELTIISSMFQDFQAVKEVLENAQNIELLSIKFQTLPDNIIDVLANCRYLTKLHLYGKCQSGNFVKKLVQVVLPNLTDLRLSCTCIPFNVANGFKVYPKLRTLHLSGSFQYKNNICMLLEKTPSIQSLNIRVDELDLLLAYAIKNCKDIENITLNILFPLEDFFETLLRESAPEHLKKLEVSSSGTEVGIGYTVVLCESERAAIEGARKKGVEIRAWS